MENNDVKVNGELEKLSEGRRKIMEGYMKESAAILQRNGFSQNNQYTMELTEKFDKEEPFQFVWMKLIVNFVQTPFMTMTPKGIQHQMGIMFKVADMDVYDQSNINGWLDHTQRIKNQNSLYYEKEGNVQKMVEPHERLMIQETKFDEDKKIHETNTMNPNPDNPEEKQNQQQNQNQPEFVEENEEEGLTDEQKINEQRFYFMPFFSGTNQVKRNKNEYLDIYTKYTRHFANRIMQTHLYGNYEERETDYGFIHQSLINMISEFEMCDFTEFTKKELEIFGFTNWRNKSMMIPLWAFPIVLKNNEGLKLIDIHSQEFIVGKDYIEEENKNGCMAVGFQMKKNGNEFELILNYDKTETNENGN